MNGRQGLAGEGGKELGKDRRVRACLSRGGGGNGQFADSPVERGDCPGFFRSSGAGKDDMGKTGQFTGEDVLDDQQLKFLQGAAPAAAVGKVGEGIAGGQVEGTNRAALDGVEQFDGIDSPGGSVQCHAEAMTSPFA